MFVVVVVGLSCFVWFGLIWVGFSEVDFLKST